MEGWLTKFTDWLKRQLVEFFNALIALIDDVMMLWIETSINNIAWVLDHIPPPQFMTDYSVSGLLRQWCTACDVELMHFVNDDQCVLEVISNAPAARLLIAVALERIQHLVSFDVVKQFIHTGNRQLEIVGNGLALLRLFKPVHASPYMPTRRK